MSRKFTQEEVNLLVSLVSQNYDFLTSSLSATKTKGMVDQKWKWIADSINKLNSATDTDNLFSVEKIKQKWFDLKSISKKAVALFDQELSKTGGGPCKVEVPPDLQFKIAETIGSVCTQGVPETQCCNTSAAQSSSKESPNTSKSANAKEASSPESFVSEEPAAKRRKNRVRSVREQTQRELLEDQNVCFLQKSK